MAFCSICCKYIGKFDGTKIDFSSGKYILCEECASKYYSLTSDSVQAKIIAITYFEDIISKGDSDNRKLINEIKDIIKENKESSNDELIAAQERIERERYVDEHANELLRTIKITSGSNFEGYVIKDYLGIVSGEVVVGTGFLSEFGANVGDFLGSNISSFSNKMKDAKNKAIEILKRDAISEKANAVIGISFDYITFSVKNLIGVSVSGTAVRIEKI